MIRTTALLVVTLLALSACMSAPGYDEFQEATKLYREGRKDEAVEAARRSVAENPEAVLPRVLIAHVYHEQGKSEDAVKELDEALKIAPDSIAAIPARTLLAQIHDEQGRWEDAVEELQQILQIEPATVPEEAQEEMQFVWLSVGFRAGEVLAREGLRDEARAYFQACLDNSDGQFYPARVHLGAMYFQEGDLETALFHLDRVVKEYPEIAYPRWLLGNVLHGLGRKVEARDQIQAMLTCKDISPQLKERAEKFLAETGS